MAEYIDGFLFTIQRIYLDEYKAVAEQVADIWKENGALSYCEYVGDDLYLKGTRSFIDIIDAREDVVIVFGWVSFPSKEVRAHANKKVASDPRMTQLVSPLMREERMIFDPGTMAYGGFVSLINK